MEVSGEKSPLILPSAGGGEPTSHSLSAAVDAGHLVRVRQGVYLHALAWVRSSPWERPLIAAAARALRYPNTVFCRETALLLHGISLLKPAAYVDVRVNLNSGTGRAAPQPMAGAASRRRREELCRAGKFPTTGKPRSDPLRVFQSIPTRRFQYPLAYRGAGPASTTKPVTEKYLDSLTSLTVPVLSSVSTDGLLLRAEPLELALLDTVHRLEHSTAVAVVDAFRGGRHLGAPLSQEEDLQMWADALPSQRARHRTRQVWDRSDARAENPGESLSRVLIHELGYAAPDLQTPLRLRDGTLVFADFFWAPGIVGEFDGDQKYLKAAQFGMTPAQAVLKEKKREDAIRRLGYRVIRWDWATLQDPQRLDLLLRNAGVPRRRLTCSSRRQP